MILYFVPCIIISYYILRYTLMKHRWNYVVSKFPKNFFLVLPWNLKFTVTLPILKLMLRGNSFINMSLPESFAWFLSRLLWRWKLVMTTLLKKYKDIWTTSKALVLEKCSYSEFFWSVFSPNAENIDQKNSEYEHFSRSD